ncbi:MAG: hypothetical protein GX442_08550 [Candidatus Riflebacteria bacterium]|nr:hypothetical protein [Candidatus Riflebacteria bacterium]
MTRAHPRPLGAMMLAVALLALLALPAAGKSPQEILQEHAAQANTDPLGIKKLFTPKVAVAGDRIRVATYNIAHARGNKRGGINEIGNLRNLDGIAALLKAEKVDIVGCTEISGVDFRSVLCDQPRFLAGRLGFKSVYGENFRIALVGAAQGNAIISRFPILSHKNHKLYRLSEKEEQRGCLEALIDLGQGRKVRVFVAHLSLKAQESGRQVQQILEMVKRRTEPCLLMGDLNSMPASSNISAITALMTDLTANVDTTYMNEPGTKIDYIFLKGGFAPDGPAWVRGFKEGYSDHGCLITSLRLAD